jgi:hypothetical protein
MSDIYDYELFLNDTGVAMILEIRNQDDEIIDISTAVSKVIKLVKPTGVVLTKTAGFVTDGTDGQIRYLTVSADLDTTGNWKIQGLVEMPDGQQHTTIHGFVVKRPL